MVTLFSWGYWGWGNATEQLIRAADATERSRGFKPPIFFDIRYRRSVRAVGFQGDAFEQVLPKGRYRWFPRLGNTHIGSGERGIKLADPFAAKILLEEALGYARDTRRIIFFCACEFPRFCHRHVVAKLVLEEAARIGRRVEIVEWPGGNPTRSSVRVTEAVFDKLSLGTNHVRLNGGGRLPDLVNLPWGSIVDVESQGESMSIITEPAKYRKGWLLSVLERCKPGATPADLRLRSEKFRKSKGLQPQGSVLPDTPMREIRALTIRQPWAHAIVHLGKDVENRSWRANYKGRLLIHASAYEEKDPRSMLAEHMAVPPSEKALSRLPTGSIIGVADLFDYVQDSGSKWAENGDWHWLLRNVVPIRPVECQGRLGLWKPSVKLLRKLPSRVRELVAHILK